jgi:hypothetical protein
VIEALGFAVGKLRPVDDRGVIEFVEVDHISAAHQAGDESQVGGVAGREDEAGFLPQELGEGALQLLVQIQGAVEEAAASAA